MGNFLKYLPFIDVSHLTKRRVRGIHRYRREDLMTNSSKRPDNLLPPVGPSPVQLQQQARGVLKGSTAGEAGGRSSIGQSGGLSIHTRNQDEVSRFWAKVEKTETCWLWAGSIFGSGYGSFSSKTWGTRLAHRISYLISVGPIPAGLQLDHLCRVRRCVNPAHLEPVTQSENQRRGFGVSGINFRRTHCKRGHEFTPENTRIRLRGQGGRLCRTCNRLDRMRRYYSA